MKKRIKDLTDEELDRLCMSYKLPCPKECRFKLDNDDIIEECKLTNHNYEEELIEVEE